MQLILIIIFICSTLIREFTRKKILYVEKDILNRVVLAMKNWSKRYASNFDKIAKAKKNFDCIFRLSRSDPYQRLQLIFSLEKIMLQTFFPFFSAFRYLLLNMGVSNCSHVVSDRGMKNFYSRDCIFKIDIMTYRQIKRLSTAIS